jgi:DNA-binding IclR family transcriptional regulator
MTDRQVAVLAALERHGRPTTVPELHADFPEIAASTIVRVLDVLVERGLVEWTGDRSWVYLGELPQELEAQWIAEGRRIITPEEVVRFHVTET